MNSMKGLVEFWNNLRNKDFLSKIQNQFDNAKNLDYKSPQFLICACLLSITMISLFCLFPLISEYHKNEQEELKQLNLLKKIESNVPLVVKWINYDYDVDEEIVPAIEQVAKQYGFKNTKVLEIDEMTIELKFSDAVAFNSLNSMLMVLENKHLLTVKQIFIHKKSDNRVIVNRLVLEKI